MKWHNKALLEDIKKDNTIRTVLFIFIGISSVLFGFIIANGFDYSDYLIILGSLLVGNGIEKIVSFKLRSIARDDYHKE